VFVELWRSVKYERLVATAVGGYRAGRVPPTTATRIGKANARKIATLFYRQCASA